MSAAASAPTSNAPEKTFRSYNKEQGANYAQHRLDYHPKLYDAVMVYHLSTGGQLDTLVDVGCGPGTAVRSLAPRFSHAFGLDPSEGMISTALSLGGVAAASEPIEFHISTAEEIGRHLTPPIADGTVDLVIAATAAHWFDMPAFWPRAAQVLKPGGTVALWCSGGMRVHPSMANHTVIQGAIDELDELVKKYHTPGNLMARDLYREMVLPWTMSPPVPGFDKASFIRKEWGTGPKSEPGDEFYAVQRPVNLDMMEKVMSTASPVTRWHQAHPELVGTEKDILKIMRQKVERAMHEAGVKKGEELVKGGVAGVLILIKKNN